MPIISLTPQDALKSGTVPTGFYRAQFTVIAPPKTSQSGKSESYYSDMVITQGEFKDKEFTVAFNTAVNKPGALNGITYTPFHYFYRVAEATLNIQRDTSKAAELDTDELVNIEFDVKIVETTGEDGVKINYVEDFYTVGTATKSESL